MKSELQKRLVRFSAKIILAAKDMQPCYAARHLYTQIVRSSTSAALNYGEAQTAESRKDFIHKLGVVLKELKETEVNLELIIESQLFKNDKVFLVSLAECRELIAIFMATRKTARSRAQE